MPDGPYLLCPSVETLDASSVEDFIPGKRTHYAKYQKMLSLVTSKKKRIPSARILTLLSDYMDTPILHSEVLNYSSQIGIPPLSRLSPVLMNFVFTKFYYE